MCIFDTLKKYEDLKPEYSFKDWWWENCAVLENAVYHISGIGKETGSWIVVLPTDDPICGDSEESHMFHIGFMKPKDLIAGDGILSCIEDRTLMILKGKAVSYSQVDTPIYRHFRYQVGDVIIIYIVTANGVVVNRWSTKEHSWIGDAVKVPLKLMDSPPLCFLYDSFLVIAELPGQYVIIDNEGQIERCISPKIFFSQGEINAFVDIARLHVYISLNGNSYILHSGGKD